jgi:hypothetical protein
VDESAQEEFGIPFDGDPSLPGFEHDRALMLRARAMLGEQASPMFGVRIDFLAASLLRPTGLIRDNPLHSDLALVNEVRIAVVLKDTKLVNVSSSGRDAPIAEVQPE